ncbi:MAG TPA: MvdC family ATP-grasp ribosomal peptide maturase [Pyrinomonadaceae bacterium]|nr:MvdC family ATP-grasp ribosomal peptide maturase [Pyrinomonadaceae bacterium]
MVIRSTGDTVLMLTHSGDYFTVDRVAAALVRRGVKTFRFNTDRFPEKIKLVAKFAGGAVTHLIKDGARILDSSAVRAVWARKIWLPHLAEDLDPNFYGMCMRESMAALESFLNGLNFARWVNEPRSDRQAENKLWQLRAAQEVGLLAPRTLMTNDPAQMKTFFREVNKKMVAKLLTPISVSMGAPSAFVHTSEVTSRDVADGNMLRHSPMVFQEQIPKACELRIAFVNGSVFVGAIDASGSKDGKVDWRLSSPEEVKWQRDEVPVEVSAKLRALMSKLGLVYGAIDLIRTPGGEHVFLEVNSGGEWGMLERDLDYPISEAIADALLVEGGQT